MPMHDCPGVNWPSVDASNARVDYRYAGGLFCADAMIYILRNGTVDVHPVEGDGIDLVHKHEVVTNTIQGSWLTIRDSLKLSL